MTDDVTRLPNAPETFITIGKARGGWTVVIATLIGRKTLRTALLWTADGETAIAEGRRIAAQRQRPFKLVDENDRSQSKGDIVPDLGGGE